MYNNSTILGNTKVTGLVILSNGSYVKYEGILKDVLIFGKSPNIIIKKLKIEDFDKYKTYFE